LSRDLIIEMTPFGARTALMRDGELVEMRFADDDVSDMRGRIYLARVKSLDNKLDAAFIDCGQDQIAYLSGRDGRYIGGKRSELPLSRQLTEGEAIVVQGSGMSRDGKKPKVTSDIQLTGMFQIYRPRRRSIKFSSKLSETGQSDRLLGLAKTLFPDGGVIYRGAAGDADNDALEAESKQLKALWEEIETKAKDGTAAPLCLFERTDPLDRILHEALKPDVDRIVAADKIVEAGARSFVEAWLPSLKDHLECQPGAFEVSGVNEQLERADQPKVDLPSGGNIVIEQTTALTAIDVNSGSSRAHEANLEAAAEIARQLRLRRIGGTIVIDFIDLKTQGERGSLMPELQKGFADDPAAIKIYPPTQLGLVQISRQRLGRSLQERLNRPCPTCTGDGRAPSLRAATERMLGELAERRETAPGEVRIAVDLYGYIAKEAIEPLKIFIDRHGLPTPVLARDDTLAPGAYRIM